MTPRASKVAMSSPAVSHMTEGKVKALQERRRVIEAELTKPQ